MKREREKTDRDRQGQRKDSKCEIGRDTEKEWKTDIEVITQEDREKKRKRDRKAGKAERENRTKDREKALGERKTERYNREKN